MVWLVELRTLLAGISQKGHTDKVRALLQEAGFNKLSEVPKEQYAQLFARAEGLLDDTN